MAVNLGRGPGARNVRVARRRHGEEQLVEGGSVEVAIGLSGLNPLVVTVQVVAGQLAHLAVGLGDVVHPLQVLLGDGEEAPQLQCALECGIRLTAG